MQRFLLFDSDCGTCSRIAQAIELQVQDQLQIMSLRNPDMQALLTEANPEWSWKPTLLEINGNHVRALTGIRMAIRFLLSMGLISTIRIAYQLHKEGVLRYAISFTK